MKVWVGSKVSLRPGKCKDQIGSKVAGVGKDCLKSSKSGGFPGGAVVENLPANAGDMGSSPGLGRSHMPHSN